MNKIFFGFLNLIIISNDCTGVWQNELLEKIAAKESPEWMQEQIRSDLSSIVLLDQNGARLHQGEVCNDDIKRKQALIRISKGVIEIFPASESAVRRAKQIRYHLQKLSQVVTLPDVEFILDVSDGVRRVRNRNVIFTFSKPKSKKSNVVLFPDPQSLKYAFVFEKAINEGMQKYPWKLKKAQAFWRGQFSNANRLEIVKLSMKFPEYVNACFSQLSEGVKMQISNLGKEVYSNPVSIADHLEYKYQILLDGCTSSWGRAFWQLLSDCVVFKEDSDYVQWYYGALQPYVHYIPFFIDDSDLINKIKWAQEHDEECNTIAQNGREFALKNLTYADMLYYIYLLLTEYAKLMECH